MLGFRSWADLATADQMMGSAANVRTFLTKLKEASVDGARREHELILNFARSTSRTTGSTLPAADTGTSSFAGQPLTLTRSRCGHIPPMPRWRRVCWRRRRGFSMWSFGPHYRAGVAFDLFRYSRYLIPHRHVGRFYLDMHPREGKDKWFSAAPIITGVRGRALPEAALVCNFPGW